MIDVKLIPESSKMDICRVLYKACIEFYQDPENMKAFEEWQKKRKEKMADAKAQ